LYRFFSWLIYSYNLKIIINSIKIIFFVLIFHFTLPTVEGPPWSWSYVRWIYNYLCNRSLSPLKLRFPRNNGRVRVLGLECLTTLSTIFRLYHGSQFYWWRKPEYPEKNTVHWKIDFTNKLFYINCMIFLIYQRLLVKLINI
jgi:hypothetical protein